MAQTAKQDGMTAPYGPWTTFKSFTTNLKETGVPTKIDSTVLKGMSGSAQSQMRTALKFLGLIDANDKVTPTYRELIQAAGTDQWGEIVRPIVTTAYGELHEGLNLEAGTLGELQERFRAAGALSGSVVEKGIRFWLSAMKDAGIKVSAHFGNAPGASGSGPKKRTGGGGRSKRSRNPAREQGDTPSEKLPEGTTRVKFPLPGKTEVSILMPDNTTDEEWSLVDGYIRGYIKLHMKG